MKEVGTVSTVYPAPEVVVVDDDPHILTIVCDLLADADILAEGCPSGTYAFKYILHRKPRVVILDVLMPGVDGIEVSQQLRADPLMKNVTIIFFTSNTAYLEQHFPDYAAHGVIVLPKPLDGDALIGIVREALGIGPRLLERCVGE